MQASKMEFFFTLVASYTSITSKHSGWHLFSYSFLQAGLSLLRLSL